MTAPDTAAFIEAQRELRKNLGTPATFQVPVAPVWPEGTKLNPDTNLPYDAAVKRANAPYTDIVKTVLIILKQGSPMRPQADTLWSEVGDATGMDIILDVAAEDYPELGEASEVIVNGLRYKIEEQKPFAIGGTVYRYLFYGKER